MRCEEAQRALALHQGDRHDRTRVEAHVAGCSTCQRFRAWSAAIDAVAHEGPAWEPSPAFTRRTAARVFDDPHVDATRRSSSGRRPATVLPIPGGLAAIVRDTLEHGAYAAGGVAWMLRQYWSLVMAPFGLVPRR
jgi:hypothetical protein